MKKEESYLSPVHLKPLTLLTSCANFFQIFFANLFPTLITYFLADLLPLLPH